jgi:hypothetical protein
MFYQNLAAHRRDLADRWPAAVASSCVKVVGCFRLAGKVSQFLRNTQHCFKELLRPSRITSFWNGIHMVH